MSAQKKGEESTDCLDDNSKSNKKNDIDRMQTVSRDLPNRSNADTSASNMNGSSINGMTDNTGKIPDIVLSSPLPLDSNNDNSNGNNGGKLDVKTNFLPAVTKTNINGESDEVDPILAAALSPEQIEAAISATTNNPNLVSTFNNSGVNFLPKNRSPDKNSIVSPEEAHKQAQLFAMYMAGFKAATQAREQLNLRKNFAAAQTQSQGQIPQAANPAPVVPPTLNMAPSISHPSPPQAQAQKSIENVVNNKTTKPSRPVRAAALNRTRVTRADSTSSFSSQQTSATVSPLIAPVNTRPRSGSTANEKSSSSGNSLPNPFPKKLMDMLSKEDSSVVCWLPRGDAFLVRNADKFISDVLPRYFRHTKLTSFQRQLNLYGFRRITKGPDGGAYRHEMFHRDQPDLCLKMKRSKQKSSSSPRITGASPRLRSNSTCSLSSIPDMTPEHGPALFGLNNNQKNNGATMVGIEPLNIAPPKSSTTTTAAATTTSTINASYSALRGVSPIMTPSVAPQTGLSILLMNGQQKKKLAENKNSPQNHHQHLIQQEIMDRERQASSLAAAGMVAERISRSRSNSIQSCAHAVQALEVSNNSPGMSAKRSPQTSTTTLHLPKASSYVNEISPTGGTTVSNKTSFQRNGTGCDATSALPPIMSSSAINNNMDKKNKNQYDLIEDLGGENATLEDMEMDFAQMFDPQNEMNAMKTDGSGWPRMQDSSDVKKALQDVSHTLRQNTSTTAEPPLVTSMMDMSTNDDNMGSAQ